MIFFIIALLDFVYTLIEQKLRMPQIQGVKGEAVSCCEAADAYCEPLTKRLWFTGAGDAVRKNSRNPGLRSDPFDNIIVKPPALKGEASHPTAKLSPPP